MAKASTISVTGALLANLGVAAVKFVGFALSGSSAMLTEAIHSVVDTLNQALLLVGMGLSRKPADESHPFGHGLEAYFWTFIVALMIFALGGALGVYEGVRKLLDPAPVSHAWLNLAIIAAAGAMEGLSLATGLRSAHLIDSPIARRAVSDLSLVQMIHVSKDPGIYEVLAEDSAAVLGLAFAAAGVVASAWLGAPWADGAASIAIGLLLVGVAALLFLETRSLLTGEAASPQVVAEVRRLLGEDPRVEQVCAVQSMHLGPEQILVAATLDFRDDLSAPELETAADELTRKLKLAEPRIAAVFVRPGKALSGAAPPAGSPGPPRRDA